MTRTNSSAPSEMRMPVGVWMLGLVSLFMDVSSEMIHSLLPLFLAGPLGASAVAIGWIEGMAEALALVVKVVSGVFSDWAGRRKPLAVAGYAIGALTKPVFALASGVGMVFAARMVDRVGKGIRGAPRDALLSDLAPPAVRGAAFGLRQALDSIGAFLGPVLAFGFMVLWAGDFRAVFWMAVVPGALAVLLLALFVREPDSGAGHGERRKISMERLRQLGRPYAWVLALAAFFGLARFSEAFLLLRARSLGVSLVHVPLVMALMNLVYGLTAFPFGRRSDRMDHTRLLAAGVVPLLLADVLLWQTDGSMFLFAAVALWGLHMGMTQGLLSRMVADASGPETRGTAFGFFHLVMGVSTLAANVIAGYLWERGNPTFAFAFGAAMAGVLLALLGIRMARRGAA